MFNPTEAQLSTYCSRMERYGRVAREIVRPGEHGVMRSKLAADLAEVVLSSAVFAKMSHGEGATFRAMVEAICGAIEEPGFALGDLADVRQMIARTDAKNPDSCPVFAYWRKEGWRDKELPGSDEEVSDYFNIGISNATELFDDAPRCNRYGCVCGGNGDVVAETGGLVACVAEMVCAWMDGFEARQVVRGAA